MFIQIDEPPKKSFALFNLGFRPFFLLSAYAAVILMVIWVLIYRNIIQLTTYYGLIDWHSHEMLFGYAVAVVAGFLLTAVRNWTNVDTITRTPLAVLALIWLCGRILPFITDSGLLITLVDLLFFALLMAAVAHPIIKARQWNNFIMIVIVLLMLVSDLLVQLQHLGVLAGGVYYGNTMMIYTILLLLLIVTGRVMPFFTRIVVPATEVDERPILEKLLLLLLVSIALADIFSVNGFIIAALATAMTVAHIIRISPWFSGPVMTIPILWVLYMGYFWIIAGFVIKVFVGMNMLTNNLAIHAWSVGGIGIITYGMMARVSLGHTGRDMVPPKMAVAGFVILSLASFIRVLMPIFSMELYLRWIEVSAVLWCLAFVLFAIAYTSILILPRVDGRAG